MRDACTTKRELAVIDFLQASGVRVGECTGLKMNDIDFNTGRCTIFGEKTQQYRTIYLDSKALKHIIDYRNELISNREKAYNHLNSEYKDAKFPTIEEFDCCVMPISFWYII